MENLREVLSEKLQALERNITPAEKAEAMAVLNISRPTLDKYLNGRGEKIETATKLIQFFTGKVNIRLSELRETNVA